jgi:hypothetical protein
MEAPVATPDTLQSVVDQAAVKPVAAESIDKTFSDSIGVFLDNTSVLCKQS